MSAYVKVKEDKIEKRYYSTKEVSELTGIRPKAVLNRLAKVRGGKEYGWKRISASEFEKISYRNRKWRIVELNRKDA